MNKRVKSVIFVALILMFVLCVFVACGKTGTQNVNEDPVEYTITFDVDGETYHTISTTGNQTISLPSAPTKTGYDFDGWYFDKDEWDNELSENSFLNEPLSKDFRVYARWTPIEYTITYKNTKGAEYNLPQTYNIESDTIELDELYVEGYSFEGWVCDGELKTEIENGSLGNITLMAKWTPFEYSVTSYINIPEAGTYTHLSAEKVAFGEAVTLEATINQGYVWLGWFDGDSKVSEGDSMIYSFTMPAENKTYIAKYAIIPELSNFYFEYNVERDTFIITGVRNNTVEEIIVPNCVCEIKKSAFEGCSKLKSITLPFVGATKDGTSNTYFGYIFGVSSYSDNSKYVPSGLEKVIITEGTSIGSYAFYKCTGLRCITIPTSIKSIGNGAFSECNGLTNITVDGNNQYYASQDGILYNKTKTEIIHVPKSIQGAVAIPDSITNIGYGVFSGCSGLTSITVPFVGATKDGTSNTHFGYIFGASSYSDNYKYVPSGLGKVIITGGTNIGSSAFYNCTGLMSITIPESVTSIGSSAFYDCTNLDAVYITDIAKWCGISFGVRNGEPMTSNPLYYAYKLYLNGKLVKDLVIPANVSNISYRAFDGCSGLTSIVVEQGNTKYHSAGNCIIETESKTLILGCNTSVIPNDGSVTSIGGYAFDGCSGLTSIIIPDSVTSIGKSAFKGCNGLTSITIPDSVTSIGKSALYGCNKLKSITLPFVGATKYGTENTNFTYIIIWDDVYDVLWFPHSLKEIVITGGTSINEDAFNNCSGLTSITIPDSVTSIGKHAFNNCDGLTSITIPDGVTSIGDYAFNGCSGLTSITIPERVTSIGDGAFNCCTDLEKIIILGANSIGSGAFACCTNLTSITIPDSVTSIGDGAFQRCKNLTNITIPDSVTYFGDSMFFECENLKYNEYNNAFYVGNETNKYVVLVKAKSTDIISCEINGNTKIISSFAFDGCSKLTSITIPESVTRIGRRAFRDCSSLTSIAFVDAVGWYHTKNYDELGAWTDITYDKTNANATYFTSTYVDYYWHNVSR